MKLLTEPLKTMAGEKSANDDFDKATQDHGRGEIREWSLRQSHSRPWMNGKSRMNPLIEIIQKDVEIVEVDEDSFDTIITSGSLCDI